MEQDEKKAEIKGRLEPPGDLNGFKDFHEPILQNLRTVDVPLISQPGHPGRERNILSDSAFIIGSSMGDSIKLNNGNNITGIMCNVSLRGRSGDWNAFIFEDTETTIGGICNHGDGIAQILAGSYTTGDIGNTAVISGTILNRT